MHPWKILLMIGLHFLAMYWLMFSMVDGWNHVRNNLNTVYMAGLMTAPMLLLELLFMGGMYANRKLLGLLAVAAVSLLAIFFVFIRQQTFIGDTQFLRSMIPHHSGAILMCDRSNLTDPEIIRLCGSIMESQQREINQMERILERIE